MRDYRDKFIAHLDNELIMNIPELEPARTVIIFYYRHIVEVEAQPGDLAELPSLDHFVRGHNKCAQEAAEIYRMDLQSCISKSPQLR
jgi:hypothetical protein